MLNKNALIVNPESSQNEITTSDSILALLNALFPEQQREDKEIKQVKEILGTLSTNFSIDEMHVLISEIQYLTNVWIDEFEKDLFNGKTLTEILHDG